MAAQVTKKRKWLGRLLWAAAALALLAGALGVYLWPRREFFYTDGERTWESTADLGLRTVLWEPGTPLEDLGTLEENYDPALAPDGQSLYFTRGRAGGRADLYVARRTPTGWAKPAPLDAVNTAADEIGPALAPDGLTLYFYSNRPGGQGGYDLYAARRKGDTWGQPANLGLAVNSAFNEYDPFVTPDGGTLLLASNRPVAGVETADAAAWRATLREQPYEHGYDLYAVALGPGGAPTAAPPRRLDVLASPCNDGQPTASPDGRWLYFASDRDGFVGPRRNYDLYRSRITAPPLGGLLPPESLGATINTPRNELDPAVSLEGFGLYFSSDRRDDGAYAIYYAPSHEVFQAVRTHRLDLAYILGRLSWPLLGLVLVLVGLGLAILAVAKFRRRPGLLATALVVSLLLHLVALSLFTMVQLTRTVSQLADEQKFEVSVSIPGLQESEASGALRAALTELARRDTARFEAAKKEPLEEKRPPAPEVTAPDQKPAVVEPAPQEVRLAEARVEPKPPTEKLVEAPKPEVRPEEPLALPAPKAEIAPREARPAQEVRAVTPRQLKPVHREETLPAPAATAPGAVWEQPAPQPVAPASDVAKAAAALRAVAPSSAVAPPRLAETAITASVPRAAEAVPVLDLGPPEKIASPRTQAAGTQNPNAPPSARPEVKAPDLVAPREALPTPRAPTAGLDLAGRAASPAALPPPMPVPQVEGAAPAVPSVPKPQFTQQAGPVVADPIRPGAVAPPQVLPPMAPMGGALTRAPEPLPAKEIYRLRTEPDRGKVIEKLGGTPETEEAVRAALLWLSRHQSRDGRWSIQNFMRNYQEGGRRADGGGDRSDQDLDLTGLVVLSFLGAGHTHMPARGSEAKSPYAGNIGRAIDWIIAGQDEDGNLMRGGQLYGQFLATMALAESYTLTGDPRLVGPIDRAVRFIAESQNPGLAWRYEPQSDNDTSVVGWGVMALKSAQIAGFIVPEKCYRGAANWLDKVRRGKRGGLYVYQPGREATPAMTAEGFFTEQLIDFKPGSPRTAESVEYVMKHRPEAKPEDEEDHDLYYWYYATLALHQVGGPRWDEWNRDLRQALVESQRKDGPFAGSWDPWIRYEKIGGRVYTTAIAALTLEVYYRYLPFYELRLSDLPPAGAAAP